MIQVVDKTFSCILSKGRPAYRRHILYLPTYPGAIQSIQRLSDEKAFISWRKQAVVPRRAHQRCREQLFNQHSTKMYSKSTLPASLSSSLFQKWFGHSTCEMRNNNRDFNKLTSKLGRFEDLFVINDMLDLRRKCYQGEARDLEFSPRRQCGYLAWRLFLIGMISWMKISFVNSSSTRISPGCRCPVDRSNVL